MIRPRAVTIVVTVVALAVFGSSRAKAGLQSALRDALMINQHPGFVLPASYGQMLVSRDDLILPSLSYGAADGALALHLPAMMAGPSVQVSVHQQSADSEAIGTTYVETDKIAPLIWLDLQSVEIRLGGLDFGEEAHVDVSSMFFLPGSDRSGATSALDPPSGMAPEFYPDRFVWQLSTPWLALSPGELLGAEIRIASAFTAGLDPAALASALEHDSTSGAYATYRWGTANSHGAVTKRLALEIVPEPRAMMQSILAAIVLGFFRFLCPTVAEGHRAVEDGLAGF